MNAVPLISPVDGSEFNLLAQVEEILEDNGVDVLFFEEEDALALARRDSTIENVLLLVNRSGVIWQVLDSVADNPERISSLANLTASLIERLDLNLNLTSLLLFASSMNLSAIIDPVRESGLTTSLLDGLLLDKDFRPRLVELIERAIRNNINGILSLIQNVIQKREYIEKREDNNDGSLDDFITNIISGLFSSSLLSNVLQDTLDALNDTGVAVYTVKRFLSNDSYINMTRVLFDDIRDTGVINLNLSNINIAGLIGMLLDNSAAISSLLSSILQNGSSADLSNFLGKYLGAFREIIRSLESDGIFEELNSRVFSSTSRRTTTTAANRKQAVTISSLSSSTDITKGAAKASTQDSGSGNLRTARLLLLLKTFFYIQALIFGCGIILL